MIRWAFIYNYIIMMGILGSLASQAIPQLLTFATKKLLNTPIGQQVAKTYRSPMVQQMKADFI